MGDELVEIGYPVPEGPRGESGTACRTRRGGRRSPSPSTSPARQPMWRRPARAAKLSRGGMGDLMDRIGVAIRPN